MNTETGELARFYDVDATNEDKMKMMLDAFTPVPKEFADEAEEIIQKAEKKGKPAFADMTKDTPLVNWAKNVENQKKLAIEKEQAETKQAQNRKTRRGMAKESRKRNRK